MEIDERYSDSSDGCVEAKSDERRDATMRYEER